MGAHVTVAALAIGVAALASDEPVHPTPVFAFQDRAIGESSGLVDLGDRVLTINDSGDGPVVYVVDAATGETVGRTTYSSGEVTDVEAVAAGPDDTVWVADIGDNSGVRPSVSVYAMPAPGDGDRTVTAQRYQLAYRDGPRDAETLLVQPRTGRLYVVSKGLFGGRVYAAPRHLSTTGLNVLTPVGDAGGLVTDGTFLADGRHVLLRDYSEATLVDSHDWESLASMRLPSQRQGEGLAMHDRHSVLVSSEGVHSQVLRVPLSTKLESALESALETALEPRPTSDTGNLADDDPPAQSVVPEWLQVGGLAAAVLAAALLVRALLRRRRR